MKTGQAPELVTPLAIPRPTVAAARRIPRPGKEIVLSCLLLLLLIMGWEIIVRLRGIPPLIVPAPTVVWESLLTHTRSGFLIRHLGVTLAEILLGFAAGGLFGIGLGMGVALSPLLRGVLHPYVIASQAMPKLALAPIFVMWFGFGLLPKVIITALIAFFPLFENTVTGLNEVDRDARELFRALGASPWQTLRWLRLPNAAPYIVAGLRVAMVLSIVGAVVAEYVGANRGLGALIISSQGMLDTPLMFAVFVVLLVLGVVLYQVVVLLERACLARRYRA
ncbi:MAG: ABC transporter permease [candidate division NC10 bacterium]|nr:ABC transporter permease [candidate division NC10 bacterium]